MTDTRLPRPERAAAMRAERRASILRAGMTMASTVGYRSMTREQIAAQAKVAVGSINHEFGTMDDLRHAVMSEAVDVGDLGIIAQGLAEKHPVACGASPDIREAAVRALA